MYQKNIGLVLSGGGVNGFLYIGAMKYFQEKGIVPKIVGGTSVGSVFAAMIAAEYSWEEMMKYTIDLEKRIGDIKDIDWRALSYSTIRMNINTTNGLLHGKKLKKEIDKLLSNKDIQTFSQFTIPYYLHMVNINTAEDVCVNSLDERFKDKKISDYIRASVSIPGIFKPHEIEGEYYVDGGIKSNYPIITCASISNSHDIKLDCIISINIKECFNREDNFQDESFLEILLRSIAISIQDQYDSDTSLFIEKYPNINLIQVDIDKIFKNSLLSAKISDTIQYGYDEVKRIIEGYNYNFFK